MKFEVNRPAMLAAAKDVAKVAPTGTHAEMLNGILVESNEDTGEIFLTATNHEVSIQQKVIGSVGESGAMLVNARLLVGMMQLLAGEFVTLESNEPEVLTVRGGRCRYKIMCLPAKHYPRPVMPFPEETVIMTGICSLAKRTVFAVSKDEHKLALQCVQIKLRNNAVHATACDGARLMMVRDEADVPDEREFLLPGRSLQMLASISKDDDVYEVGNVGNDVVFVRGDMMFTIRKLAAGDYIDATGIIRGIKPAYTAVTDAAKLKEALDIIEVASRISTSREPVNMVLTDDEIILRCKNDYHEANTVVSANISAPTPETGFFYDVASLAKLFQIVDGKVRIELDSKGFALIKTRQEVYMQIPMRGPIKKEKPAKQTEKSAKKTASAKGAKELNEAA